MKITTFDLGKCFGLQFSWASCRLRLGWFTHESAPPAVRVSTKLERYLDAIEESGFFGLSPEEVCERLICQRVEQLVMAPEPNPLRERLHEIMQTT